MQTYKLTLCYDGSRYYGWQRLTDSEQTIQGKLESVLSRFAGKSVEVHGSGRTDAGVHARMQVASFSLNKEASCQELRAYLEQYLPEDIGVLSVEKAEPRFHARLNAKGKTYCYYLWTDTAPCVFERKYCYIFREELNITEMKKAAVFLCGTHDFAAFCSTKHTNKSTVRTVQRIDITKTEHGLCFTFTGDGFLHHMVRILTGTLLEVGRGLRTAESMLTLFSSKRENCGFTVPAKGLFLTEVEY